MVHQRWQPFSNICLKRIFIVILVASILIAIILNALAHISHSPGITTRPHSGPPYAYTVSVPAFITEKALSGYSGPFPWELECIDVERTAATVVLEV